MKGKEMWRRDEVRLVICSEDICEDENKDSIEIVDNASWLWTMMLMMLIGLLTIRVLY